jgi:hypothetical protein
MSKAEILEISTEDYHALKGSWSHSQAEVLLESPALFYGRFLAEPRLYERKKSTALDWGQVADAALTHPEGADSVMRVIPDYVLNSEGHRKGSAWLNWAKDNAGKILLKASECAAIIRAVEHCKAHPLARRILEAPGEFQHTVRWTDDETGLVLRCRLDKVAYLSEGLILADIKTTRNEQPREFSKDAYVWGYGRQAAWYWDGMVELGEDPEAWINVAIGKPDPQTTVVYEMCQEAIALGRVENRKLLRELAERIAKNDWTQRDEFKLIMLDFPKWAYRPDEYELPVGGN